MISNSTGSNQSINNPNQVRHSFQNSSSLLSSSKIGPKIPIGLRNIGNTCFLNSTIQFLFSVDKLKTALIKFYGKVENMDPPQFCKLLGKLFTYIDQRSQARDKIYDILQRMAKQLQQLNVDYIVSRQDDALGTLLNILSEIQYFHPQLAEYSNIKCRFTCSCQSYIIDCKYLSYKSTTCLRCYRQSKTTIVNAPDCIIFAKPEKIMALKEKTEVGQIDQQPFELIYRLKSQIIYFGNGFSGHYITRRYEEDSCFILDDEKVEVDKYLTSKNSGLLLLYQLKEKRKIAKKDNNSKMKSELNSNANTLKQPSLRTNNQCIMSNISQNNYQQKRFLEPSQQIQSLTKQKDGNHAYWNQVHNFQIKMFNLFASDTHAVTVRYIAKKCIVKIFYKDSGYGYQIVNKKQFPYFDGKDKQFDKFYNEIKQEKNQLEKIKNYIQNHLISCSFHTYNGLINTTSTNQSQATNQQPHQLSPEKAFAAKRNKI